MPTSIPELLTGLEAALTSVALDQIIVGDSESYIDIQERIEIVTIDNSNKWIDFAEKSFIGFWGAEINAELTTGSYTRSELVAHIGAIMTAASGLAATYTAALDGSDVITISGSGGILEGVKLLWKTGAHGSDNSDDHAGTLLGYSDAADDEDTSAPFALAADGAMSFAEEWAAEAGAQIATGSYGTLASLLSAVETALDAAGAGTYTVSQSSGVITISATGVTGLRLLWSTGTNVASNAGALLGYSTDADDEDDATPYALTADGTVRGYVAAHKQSSLTVASDAVEWQQRPFGDVDREVTIQAVSPGRRLTMGQTGAELIEADVAVTMAHAKGGNLGESRYRRDRDIETVVRQMEDDSNYPTGVVLVEHSGTVVGGDDDQEQLYWDSELEFRIVYLGAGK